jgi:hypothetical protein
MSLHCALAKSFSRSAITSGVIPGRLSDRGEAPQNESGAEGIRTPDLRRAKAVSYFARGFWSLQNPCKWALFRVIAFLSISGDLLVLLHGCCH